MLLCWLLTCVLCGVVGLQDFTGVWHMELVGMSELLQRLEVFAASRHAELRASEFSVFGF